MTQRTSLLPPLFAASLLAASPLAQAQQVPSPAQEREQVQLPSPPPSHSLSDAVRRVERNTRGEVLSAERIQYDGRDMHRVKVVDDRGRVRVFMQDPARASRPPQTPPRDDE